MVFRKLCVCGKMLEAGSYPAIKTLIETHKRECRGEVPLF